MCRRRAWEGPSPSGSASGDSAPSPQSPAVGEATSRQSRRQTWDRDVEGEDHAFVVSRAPETATLDQLAGGASTVLALDFAYPRIGMQAVPARPGTGSPKVPRLSGGYPGIGMSFAGQNRDFGKTPPPAINLLRTRKRARREYSVKSRAWSSASAVHDTVGSNDAESETQSSRLGLIRFFRDDLTGSISRSGQTEELET